MSKITRKKLVKGTKLPAQNLNNFFTDVASAVNTPTINKENLPYKANFDLNFNTRIVKNNIIANKGWKLYSDTGPLGTTMLAGDMGSPIPWQPIPDLYINKNIYQHFHFILPNTQEVFDLNGLTNNNYVYSLNRIVVSVDTLDNPASTHPNVETTTNGTYHSLSGTDAMDIIISLHRKTPYRNNSTTYWEEKVGEWTVPYAAFLNSGLDTNPFSFEDLKLKIFPDAVYLLSITSNYLGEDLIVKLDAAANTFAQTILINNLQITLGFACELLDYDAVTINSDVASIQNAPYSDQISPWILQNTLTNTIAIAPSDQITEANVQGNMSAIDIPQVRKLVGGYETDSSMPHHQQIKSSACYETKQVPLFNNNQLLYGWKRYRNTSADTWGLYATEPGFTGTGCAFFPYTDSTPVRFNPFVYDSQRTIKQVVDRKFFPIHEPFILHHLFMTYWVGSPAYEFGQRPENANTYFEIDVFLHTLNRSDSAIRHRIAHAKWQPVVGTDLVTANNLLVDKALWLEQQNSQYWANNSNINPCGFTVQIPVNYGTTASTKGIGYSTTGKPLFMGRGYYPYSAYDSNRTSIFKDINNSTQVNYTQGQEQYYEVVFRIANPDGIGCNLFSTQDTPDVLYPNYTVNWAETGTKLQQPGAMLYMIGKKFLVDSRGNH